MRPVQRPILISFASDVPKRHSQPGYSPQRSQGPNRSGRGPQEATKEGILFWAFSVLLVVPCLAYRVYDATRGVQYSPTTLLTLSEVTKNAAANWEQHQDILKQHVHSAIDFLSTGSRVLKVPRNKFKFWTERFTTFLIFWKTYYRSYAKIVLGTRTQLAFNTMCAFSSCHTFAGRRGP